MKSVLVAVVVFAVLGCKGTTASPGDAASDSAACECHLEAADGGAAVLTMSWPCYCASRYADGCTRTLASRCTSTRDRVDYPGCGLTVLSIRGSFGPNADVYDQNGTLVGAMASSDTSAYVCPSDPSVTGLVLRAGQFPAASCEPVASSCPDAGI